MSKADQTREYIIMQTASIFNRKGYAGTSMSDLTKATGLSKGAIYGNFKSKDEVAIEAFRYNMDKITSGIEGMMRMVTSPLDKLKVFPTYYKEVFRKKMHKSGCPIVNGAPEADDTHPALKKCINSSIDNWKKGIEYLVNAGVTEGEIRPDTNAADVAIIIITQIEGGLMIAKSTGDTRYLNIALNQVEKLIEDISVR